MRCAYRRTILSIIIYNIHALKITDGPNFRGFALMNGILSESYWNQTFTMDQEIPADSSSIHTDKKKFAMDFKMFGRGPGEDADEFVFIGRITWKSMRFYVGNYNTCTRTGQCDEIPAEEFFKSAIMRRLFPNLV